MSNPFGSIFGFLKTHVGDIVGAVIAAEAIGGSGADKKTKAIQFAGLGLQAADPFIAQHPKVKAAEDAVIEAVVNLSKAHQQAEGEKPQQG